MKWDDIGEMPCSVARALSVIGDRWTMLILRNCFLGTRRFEQFQKHIGLSRHRLSDRLKTLVDEGILRKQPYQDRPVRYEYRLTEKGVDLYPVLMTLAAWGDKWMAGEDGPPMEYVHTTCGHLTHPTLCCSECGEVIDPRAMRPRIGPGLIAYGEKARKSNG